MTKYKLITSILGSSLFRFSITLGVSLGVALNSGGVLAEHVTNKWDIRRGLESDNWTVIYSEEFGTDDWVQLTLALVADAYGCAGGCTSAFIQNFGYQSYNTIVQELGRKSPDMLNSFLSAMTKTDFGSLLASALKDGNVESRNLPGVRLQLGSSAYNRKECEFGICVPLPNSHQPYIRVKFLAGSNSQSSSMIVSSYQVVFGRSPTTDEVNYWTNRSQSEGLNESQLIEYHRQWLKGGGDLTETIVRSYQTVLSRQPNTEEINYWRARIRNSGEIYTDLLRMHEGWRNNGGR